MIARHLLVLAAAAATIPLPASATASETIPGCAAAIAYSNANRGLALLVLRDGEAVCETEDTATPHELWSGTKSLVGLMAAAAVQDGLLTLDESAAATITEWRGDPEKAAITLRQLLAMTSGQPSAVGRPQGYAASLDIALAAKPGAKFQYGPTPLQIFGEVMRRKLAAAGQAPDPRRYLERRLLTPLGVRVGGWRNGPDGHPLMPQGLALAATEWAKIGEFVRLGGRSGGKPLVDETAFSALFRGSEANPAYGLTWWLPRVTASDDPVTRSTDIIDPAGLPADLVVAAGAGDQRLYVIPSLRLTIVRQARLDVAAMLAGRKDEWSDKRFLSTLLAQ